MSGLMHTKVELYACGQFGTVTKLQTEESASCSSRVETTSVTLRLIGSDSYGISLKRVAAPSSSEQPCICTTTVIEAVAPHSAAFHSGRIQAGDRLIAVNGRSTSALTIDEIYENMEGGDGATDLMIEFDVYETSVTPSSIVAVRLIKRSSVLGIEFRAGSGRKEDPIVVKSLLPASVAHRSGAIEAGDEFLMIDDVPLSGCTVQESLRLLQTSHDFGEDGTWGLPNERKLTVPLMNRLNLVDIHKVITDLTASYQNQELQALRAFEKVRPRDALLLVRSRRKCAEHFDLLADLHPRPHTKNVLLLRDAEQQGFGFSISESEEGAVFVSGVKAGGMAEQNGNLRGRPDSPG
ncbi:hypothetical protein M3Y99_00549200 [Aphelenchoides fujianensis]|nr:hypothetical protein M3Y99_00549200 [Aphelenchoides fujianensis]